MADKQNQTERQASLHRIVMDDHLCPFGLKTKDLLERKGYQVDDHPLQSTSEKEAFMEKHGVDTTPQVFINDKRIGGYEEVRRYLGEDLPDDGSTTYRPVLAIFCMAALIALAINWLAYQTLYGLVLVKSFIAVSMCLLALQKLKDVESFSTMFLNYDLLARRWVRYGYIYPYAEGLAGVLMLAGILPWLSAPVSLFIGTIGAASVIKAVYIDNRELKCACVGGDTNVPLGAVSLTENLMMIFMGIWVLVEFLA